MSSATARLLDNHLDDLNGIIYDILTTRFSCGDLTIISDEFSHLFDVSTLVNIINSDRRISAWFTLSDYNHLPPHVKDLIIAKQLDRVRLKSCDRLILRKQQEIAGHVEDEKKSLKLAQAERVVNDAKEKESQRTQAHVDEMTAKRKGMVAVAQHKLKQGVDKIASLAASSPSPSSSSKSRGESIYDLLIRECNQDIEKFEYVKTHMDDTYFETELLSKNNKLQRIEKFFRAQATDAQSAVIYCGNITCQRSLRGESLSVVVNYKLNISSEVKVTIDPATQLEIFDSVQTDTVSVNMLAIVNTRENKIERCKTCVIDVLGNKIESLQTAPPAPPSALSSMTPNGTHGDGMYSFDLDGNSTIIVMNPELPVVVSQQGCLGRCCFNDFIGGTKKTKKKSRHSKRKSKNMRRKNKSRRKKTY